MRSLSRRRGPAWDVVPAHLFTGKEGRIMLSHDKLASVVSFILCAVAVVYIPSHYRA
jgi:hypothetical protein